VSARELYQPSDRCLSAKWLPTFADRGCHVVSMTDPYGRILDFLDRSHYFCILYLSFREPTEFLLIWSFLYMRFVIRWICMWLSSVLWALYAFMYLDMFYIQWHCLAKGIYGINKLWLWLVVRQMTAYTWHLVYLQYHSIHFLSLACCTWFLDFSTFIISVEEIKLKGSSVSSYDRPKHIAYCIFILQTFNETDTMYEGYP
jgi:hypothetical protein